MDDIGLALEWFPNVDHVPFFVGIEKGFFNEYNINLNIFEPINHEAGMLMVLNNKMDFAITEPLHIPSFSNSNLKAFMNYFNVNTGVMSKEYIERPKDFKGKTFASPLGKYTGIIIKEMAKNDGIDIDNDFKIIKYSYYLTDALINNIADASYSTAENYEPVEAKMKGLKVNFIKTSDYNIPSYGYRLIVSNLNNLKNKDLILNFQDALKKSIEYALKNPDDAYKIFISYVPDNDNIITKEIYKNTLKCFNTDFSINENEICDLIKFSYDNKIINKKIKYNDIIYDKYF